MEGFETLWCQRGKVISRSVQQLPGLGLNALCGCSYLCGWQHCDGHSGDAVCDEACVVGIVTRKTKPAAICRGLQKCGGTLFEGGKVFYKPNRSLSRQNCLSKDWNVATAHAVEYEDVVVRNAEAAEDLG